MQQNQNVNDDDNYHTHISKVKNSKLLYEVYFGFIYYLQTGRHTYASWQNVDDEENENDDESSDGNSSDTAAPTQNKKGGILSSILNNITCAGNQFIFR